MIYNSVLELIGETPIVRLNKIPAAVGREVQVLAKLEFFNPGGSVKDRIAPAMIREAENKGLIKPGGTIIEASSGNTTIGLAILAINKGYKLIVTTTDKQSKEKISILEALGAKVIVCPSGLPATDPRNPHMVAQKLSEEIPNSFFANQNHNPSNSQAHYETTAKEIWEDTNGEMDCFVAGIGTGGTLVGVGKFLKEKNKRIKVVGVEPVGSVFYDYFYHKKLIEPKPYLMEGLGSEDIPSIMDFSIIDEIIQVSDRDAYRMTRRIIREEGILTGPSSGAALCGALTIAKKLNELKTIVVIFPDTVFKYASKLLNKDWLKEHNLE